VKVDRDAPPTVRPMAPKAGDPLIEGKIRIEAGPKPGNAVKHGTIDPGPFWMEYYRTHKPAEKPSISEALREEVTLLNLNKKFRDVEAMLRGFLQFNSKYAEPWMYSALALSMKMNKGREADIKTAMGYAADLAVRSRNPNHLVSVADQLLLMGYLDRAGALLDQAALLVPHRGEPLMMSINLAQKTKDPKRMGDSIDALLSLGWPGYDEIVRRDARKQAETLAKTLREDGRGAEADALLARLPAAEARDLFIRLTWVGDAGLDLAVEEPLGATARVLTPRTVFGGSIIKDGYGSHPEEVYVCPRGFDGVYTIRVETTYNNPEKPALQATLEIITHEGTPQEHKETRTVKLGAKGSEPVKVTLKGGRREKALPFLAPVVLSPPSLAGSQPKPDKDAKPLPADREKK
jgi:hypothetical protein